jgi:hypothetical protein
MPVSATELNVFHNITTNLENALITHFSLMSGHKQAEIKYT